MNRYASYNILALVEGDAHVLDVEKVPLQHTVDRIHVDPLVSLSLSNVSTANPLFPLKLLKREQESRARWVPCVFLDVSQDQRLQEQEPDAVLFSVRGTEKHRKDVQQKGVEIYLLETRRNAPL